MASLATRLQALEARPPKIDAEHDRRLQAALDALHASYSHRNEWAPSKEPPFYWVEQPSDIEQLWDRIQTGTTTEADNATMGAWPKCHLDPVQLVEMLATLLNEH